MADLTLTTDMDVLLGSASNAVARSNLGLGTAAITDSTAYATAAQGALADSSVQSSVSGEPSGSDQVVNVVSLTQAEYDAGTPVATTFYVITT